MELSFFFFNDTATTEIYTLSLHDALPISLWCGLVFLSGYVIVALEIVWVRLLGQVGQFHAYLFPTVLGVFLLADGAGMAWGARMLRRAAVPRPAFFAAQGGGFRLASALCGALL